MLTICYKPLIKFKNHCGFSIQMQIKSWDDLLLFFSKAYAFHESDKVRMEQNVVLGANMYTIDNLTPSQEK